MRRPRLVTLVCFAAGLVVAVGNAYALTEERGTPREEEALAAWREGKLVRAREIAESILRTRPDSVRAELVLGVALQDAEGNIPLALRHYEQALSRVSLPDGRPVEELRAWHLRLLLRKISALSDLGRYEDLLDSTRLYRQVYVPGSHAADVWPLMKLGRVEEARLAASRALTTGDKLEEVIAKNGLCALDGYPACMKMLEAVRASGLDPGLALRNAAVSALEAGRYGEAERMLLESTRYPDENTNPWRDLAVLYIAEGRLGEALDASREMLKFSHKLPLRVRQHSNAEDLVTAAQILLLSGHTVRAAKATSRALSAPDRASHLSGSAQELMAPGQLLDRAVQRTLAEEERERSAIVPWYGAPLHGWRALLHSTEAWLSGRDIQPLLESGGMRPGDRRDRLRPELSAPGWLLSDAVALFGAGPTLALLEDTRRAGPIDDDPVPAAIRESERLAVEAEALWVRGDLDGCYRTAERARAALPTAEVMMRARLALRMAQSAYAKGNRDAAWPLFEEVLARDPGALRRLGATLPVAMADDGANGATTRAARHALSTPRFVRDDRSPFTIAAQGGRLCLLATRGNVLNCTEDPGPRKVRVAARATPKTSEPPPPEQLEPEDLSDPPRRLALAFVTAAFAPRVDLSQQDLSTLDGTPIAERGLDAGQLDGMLENGSP